VGDAHTLDNLDVLHPGENLVLDTEGDAHAECSALLDGERFVFERGEGVWLLKVDNNIRAAFDLEGCEIRSSKVRSCKLQYLECQREDDALAGIVWICDSLAGANA